MVKAIGLVLGAGGLTGSAFHAGVLAALHEATGWDPRGATVVVGTSAGASTAAYLRAGFAAEDLFAEAVGGELSPEAARRHAALPPLRLGPVTNDALAPLPEPAAAGGGEREAAAVRVGGDAARRRRPGAPALAAAGLLRWPLRPGLVLAGALPRGELDTASLGARVRACHEGPWPDAPTWVCAVRVRDGARVVFGRDNLAAADLGVAVEASCAVPGFLAPVAVEGVEYVDGGAYSPTNADLTAPLGLDAVVVIAPQGVRAEAIPASARWGARGVSRVLNHRVLERELRPVRSAGTVVVVIEPDAADVAALGRDAFDAARRPQAAARARASAAALLAQRPELAEAMAA